MLFVSAVASHLTSRKTIGIPSDARPPQAPLVHTTKRASQGTPAASAARGRRPSAADSDQPPAARGRPRSNSQTAAGRSRTTPAPMPPMARERRGAVAAAAASNADSDGSGGGGTAAGVAGADGAAAGVLHKLPSMTDYGQRQPCIVCERNRPVCILSYCYGACETCATLWVHCQPYGIDIDEVRRVWNVKAKSGGSAITNFPAIARKLKELGVLHSEKAAKRVWEAAVNVSALNKFTLDTPVVRANQPSAQFLKKKAAAASVLSGGGESSGVPSARASTGSKLKTSTSAATLAVPTAPPQPTPAVALPNSARGSSSGALQPSTAPATAAAKAGDGVFEYPDLPRQNSTTAAPGATGCAAPSPSPRASVHASMSGAGGATAALKSLPMPSMTDFGPRTDCVVCGKSKSTCLLQHALGACETCATLWVQSQRHGLVLDEVRRVWQLGKWSGQFTAFVNAARNLKSQGALESDELSQAALQSVGGSVNALSHYQAGEAEKILAKRNASGTGKAKAASPMQTANGGGEVSGVAQLTARSRASAGAIPPPSGPPSARVEKSGEGVATGVPRSKSMPSSGAVKSTSKPAPVPVQPPHPPGKTFSLPSMQDFGPKQDCVVCKIFKTTCTLQDALGACERCAVLCIQCARYGCSIDEVRRLYKLQGNVSISLSKFPEIAKNMKEQGLLTSNAVAKKALKQCGNMKGLSKFKMPKLEEEVEERCDEDEAADEKPGVCSRKFQKVPLQGESSRADLSAWANLNLLILDQLHPKIPDLFEVLLLEKIFLPILINRCPSLEFTPAPLQLSSVTLLLCFRILVELENCDLLPTYRDRFLYSLRQLAAQQQLQ